MATTSPRGGLRPFQPSRFGRYTLLTPIANGGMGAVYLARIGGVEGFEKFVVIKKILPALAQDREFVDRFVNEAKILVKLHHGSVAQVLDMGVVDGEYYIAMEFVDGKDLRKVAARARETQSRMPVGLALFACIRVLDALAYAHRKKDEHERELNLVHRDVSPQNVLISYEGEVKVIDFGLAKSAMSLGRTNPSMILGKFFYMSPEQARHKEVDRRSDLYAVGICLWELLVGKNPFDDVPPGEIMFKVAQPSIPGPKTLAPEVPDLVNELVLKALAPDPKDRFATAEEMRGRLTSAMLDVDPGAGPEALASYMREQFAREFESERRAMANLAKLKIAEEKRDHDDEPPPKAAREDSTNVGAAPSRPADADTPVPRGGKLVPLRRPAAEETDDPRPSAVITRPGGPLPEDLAKSAVDPDTADTHVGQVDIAALIAAKEKLEKEEQEKKRKQADDDERPVTEQLLSPFANKPPVAPPAATPPAATPRPPLEEKKRAARPSVPLARAPLPEPDPRPATVVVSDDTPRPASRPVEAVKPAAKAQAAKAPAAKREQSSGALWLAIGGIAFALVGVLAVGYFAFVKDAPPPAPPVATALQKPVEPPPVAPPTPPATDPQAAQTAPTPVVATPDTAEPKVAVPEPKPEPDEVQPKVDPKKTARKDPKKKKEPRVAQASAPKLDPRTAKRKAALTRTYEELSSGFEKLRAVSSCQQIGTLCTYFKPEVVDKGYERMIESPDDFDELQVLLENYGKAISRRRKELGLSATP